VKMTHLTGTSTALKSSIQFTVPLPASASTSAAGPATTTHLSFSPCGAYLLAVSSSDVAETVTVLEQQGGCINKWEPVWCERVARFTGEGDGSPGTSTAVGSSTPIPMTEPRRLISSRWLGEPRRVRSSSSRSLLPCAHLTSRIVVSNASKFGECESASGCKTAILRSFPLPPLDRCCLCRSIVQ
jgi:hypothetical protein